MYLHQIYPPSYLPNYMVLLLGFLKLLYNLDVKSLVRWSVQKPLPFGKMSLHSAQYFLSWRSWSLYNPIYLFLLVYFWSLSQKITAFKEVFSVCARIFMYAWRSLKVDAGCPNCFPHHSLKTGSLTQPGVWHFGVRLGVSKPQGFSISIFNSNTVLGLKLV